MVMRFARLLGACATVVALGAGCEAELEEGKFSCGRDGTCPDGWYCHSDTRCYSDEEEATGGMGAGTSGTGGSGGGTGGSGPPGGTGGTGGTGGAGGSGGAAGGGSGTSPQYAPCASGDECASGSCSFGPDPQTEVGGVCSTACTTTADCPTFNLGEGVCLGGECLVGCTSGDDCRGTHSCHEATTTSLMGPTVFACFTITDPALSGAESCTLMPATCPSPASCIAQGMISPVGVCTMRCGPIGECPADTDCVEVFEGAAHCLRRCVAASDCGTDLTCATFGTDDFCIPTAWDGMSPPLAKPEPPPMP